MALMPWRPDAQCLGDPSGSPCSRMMSRSSCATAARAVITICPPGWRCRSPRSAIAAALPGPQLLGLFEQVAHRAAEPVESPDHQGVARPRIVQRGAQLPPVHRRARGVVNVDPVGAGFFSAVTWRSGAWSSVETRAYAMTAMRVGASQKRSGPSRRLAGSGRGFWTGAPRACRAGCRPEVWSGSETMHDPAAAHDAWQAHAGPADHRTLEPASRGLFRMNQRPLTIGAWDSGGSALSAVPVRRVVKDSADPLRSGCAGPLGCAADGVIQLTRQAHGSNGDSPEADSDGRPRPRT